ncbi:maleylacetate reductase [Cordyceps fumosorosea ARSEF 2679]|uniref:Maleylacetate reductase n=1 Tax=Cordyceps fumosorosea (strain ARSEF 2679) TaxID=1081104 RepID=A0A168E4V3_CORFA|nr:maleylacetate reductase [Cordyceps fumosorosea ARSEF 2679]OAA73377.1 maleylacetate reductase [Cordyceps fumosorosea ARSEF 2679]
MNPMSPKVATAASHAAASSRTANSSAAAAAGSAFSAPSPGHRSTKSSSSSRRAVRSDHEPRRTNSKSPSSKPQTTSTPPSRIVYGPGAINHLPNELGRLRLTSPLMVVSPSRMATARHIQALIPNLNTHILDSAVVNVRAQLVDDAVERVKDRDCVISVGGSSAVGLARAVSIRKGIPHICIPTTYSGSEVLHLFDCDVPISTGQPDGGAASAAASRRPSSSRQRIGSPLSDGKSRTSGSKNSSKHSAVSVASRDAKQRVKPAVIIYDEELTTSVPRRILIPANTGGRQPPSADDAQSPSSKWSFMQLPGI